MVETNHSQNPEHGLPDPRWKDLYRIGFFSCAAIPGLIIQAIGTDHERWHYGTEEAFPLLPTYLLTGLAAISLSLALITWSPGFLHTRHGATVVGLLFVGMFLFGGGSAAQVMSAPFAWAAATRIHKPLTWWRKVLSEGIRPGLARLCLSH